MSVYIRDFICLKKFEMTNKYFFVSISIKLELNIDDFIQKWSEIYSYSNSHLYSESISKHQFVDSDLENLFEWKNGMSLSGKKRKSFNEKIKIKLAEINDLKVNWNQLYFNNYFESLSAIWKIFLMHIIRPAEKPIFDQHVYRAFKYIEGKNHNSELENTSSTKLKIYFEEYLPFYHNLKNTSNNNFSDKQLDDALWAFGKLLKEYPQFFN
jgi:hypothetical protein